MSPRFIILLFLFLVVTCRSSDDSDDERSVAAVALRRSCQQFEPDKQHPVVKQTRVAYAMAVLSTLAYCLPFDSAFFRIVKNRSIHRIRRLFCQGRQLLKNCFRRVTLRRSDPVTCPRSVRQKASAKFELKYWFKDWREPTILPGVRYHDTDLLVVKRRDEIILVFSGSASPTDHATNIQTLEKASHAGLFPGNGSLHRGFLNAYSRVDHGLIYSFTNVTNGRRSDLLQALFGNCLTDQRVTRGRSDWIGVTTNDMNATTISHAFKLKHKRKGGCRVKLIRLRHLLLLVVEKALLGGKRVHIAGHSLVINFEHLPIRKLHLWTFGAPQIANGLFWDHFANNTRVQSFLRKNWHRFVTFSDRCNADMISSIVPGGSHGQSRPIYLPTRVGTSVLSIHSMTHYQLGLSASGKWSTDLPVHTRKTCLGEDIHSQQQ